MIGTRELLDFLPHREDFVWIDHVIGPGLCQVLATKDKHYFSGEFVRQSTYIEWIAQSFGFGQAFELKLQGKKKSLDGALLVSVKCANFSKEYIRDQEEVFIEVVQTLDLGNVAVIDGKVYSKRKKYCVLRSNFKAYVYVGYLLM